MELIIVSGLAMLVVGFLAGRLSSTNSGSDSGGIQFMVNGHRVQLAGWLSRVIWFDVMTPIEREEMTRIDRLHTRGRKPTDEQLAYAQNIWITAFKRWLATDDGQDWAAWNAPHLLGD